MSKSIKQKKCRICNTKFTPPTPLNAYCSGKCKIEGYLQRESRKPKTKKCKICKETFKPYTSLDKFCSSDCRIKSHKSKRKFSRSEEFCKNRTGNKNPAYKHGMYSRTTTKNQTGLKEFARNKNVIIQKMIDDVGYVYCQNCKTSNSLKFESHHIIFRSEKPGHEHLHSKQNIIHLCIICHNKFHKQKSYRNELVKERKLKELFGNEVLDK